MVALQTLAVILFAVYTLETQINDKKEFGLFKEELLCTGMLCFVAIHIAVTTLAPSSIYSAAKDQANEHLKTVEMVPWRIIGKLQNK